MIDILLASYNGEKYIAEQIDSILNQTFDDWILYIKDDCSTDNTATIILEYEKKYKDKIKIILSDKQSGSAKNNFFSMLKYSKSDYIMLCDQDDIWMPDKVEITYNAMLKAEQENNDIPVLVHTDLKVVDENLNVISDSLLKMQKLDSRKDKINNLLVQNIVTGCTVMVNKKLINYINKPPQHAVMHDWWFALIAASLGKIVFIDKKTVLYRQHGMNSVGAKDVNSKDYLFKMLKNVKMIKKSFEYGYIQSNELLNTIGEYLEKEDYELINQYSLLIDYNKLGKIKVFKKYRMWKNSVIKALGQLLFC